MVIFFIAASFSIASNFNFLYSNFMRDDVTARTLESQMAIFRDDLVQTRTQLLEREAVAEAQRRRADLDVEFDNLRKQIMDPLRPGCGELCRGHIAEIERILGRQMTDLAIPALGTESDVVEDWYQRLRETADEIFLTSMRANAYPRFRDLIQRIDRALLAYDTPERVIAEGDGLDALGAMSALSRDVEREANALLAPAGRVEHRHIDPSLGRLGEIVYSFRNGFGEMPNPMATAMALVIGAVVDLLPFMMAFAIFGRGRVESEPRNQPATTRGGKRRILS